MNLAVMDLMFFDIDIKNTTLFKNIMCSERVILRYPYLISGGIKIRVVITSGDEFFCLAL